MANAPGGSPETTPTSIERRPDRGLRIAWSDGETRDYTAAELRDACPCATCREKNAAPAAAVNPLAILPIEEAAPVDIAGMRPVGAYAYAISFTDGHSNGLFTFGLLRQLGVSAKTP